MKRITAFTLYQILFFASFPLSVGATALSSQPGVTCRMAVDDAQADVGAKKLEWSNPERIIRGVTECLKSVTSPEEKATFLRLRASAYFQLKKYPTAIVDYEEWLKLRPAKTFWDLTELIVSYRANGQAKEALKIQLKAIGDHLSPQGKGFSLGMPTYYHLGWTYLELKQYHEAIESFSEGLTYQTDFVFAYARRAVAYDAIGQNIKAREDINKALKLVKNLEDSTTRQKMEMGIKSDPAIIAIFEKYDPAER